jgi:hypothetical protein
MKTSTHPRLKAAIISSLFAAALLLSALRAQAQANANPPNFMTYQGYLVDGNGNALGTNAPKNYDVIFRIWDAATGGATPLWAEQQTVTVDKGYFSVLLGEGSSIGEPRPALNTIFTTATASDRWVGLTVKGIGPGGADANILPRLRMLAAPYSYLAQKAITASTVDAAALTSGTVSDSRLSPNVALRNAPNTFTGNQTITGGTLYLDNSVYLNARNASGAYEGFLVPRWSDNVMYLNYGSSGFAIRNNSSTVTTMFMQNNGTVSFSGNVGIGTGAPGFPLNFASALGDKISLYGNSGNHFGFGIAPSLLQIHADVNSSDIAFGYGNSASMTELMRIKGNGNVGIGTSNPEGKLHVSGGSILMDNSQTLQAKNSAGVIENWMWPRWVDNVTYLNCGAGGFNIRNNASISRMFITDAGRVGINTSNPQAALHVAGTTVTANGTMNWFRYEFPNNAPTQDGSVASATIAYFQGQVVSSDAICSMANPTFSDARAKKILGRSSGEQDLTTLDRLQITDFRWIDQAKGNTGVHKKVIAQEVEKVLPDAVSRLSKAIPSVYQHASTVNFDSNQKQLTLSLTKAHDLQPGDEVDVYTDRGDLQKTKVLRTPSAESFTIASEFDAKKAFVYGKWVNDYRVVDYDAISMLNVSATQELHRKLLAQANEIAQLKQALAEMVTKAEEREKEISAVRQQAALQVHSVDGMLAKIQERDQRLATIEQLLRDKFPQQQAAIETSAVSNAK